MYLLIGVLLLLVLLLLYFSFVVFRWFGLVPNQLKKLVRILMEKILKK